MRPVLATASAAGPNGRLPAVQSWRAPVAYATSLGRPSTSTSTSAAAIASNTARRRSSAQAGQVGRVALERHVGPNGSYGKSLSATQPSSVTATMSSDR